MIEWPTILSFVTVLLAIGFSVYRERMRPSVLTREQMLEKQVEELQSTVQILLRDRTTAQQQIDALRQELNQATARIAQLQTELSRYSAKTSLSSVSVLLAVVGEDPALQVDLAALRKVANRTGIRMTRLSPVSRASLERTLNGYRKTGEPLRWVHASVHAGPNGLEFSDGVASGQWLSEHFRGVEILLINGCESDVPADWAGVVPAVVSMREEIEHADAAIFCEVFWMAVGEGLSAEAAFDRALDRCPPVVAEFAELHV